jgi:hypothetical protein
MVLNEIIGVGHLKNSLRNTLEHCCSGYIIILKYLLNREVRTTAYEQEILTECVKHSG